jgi:histone H3/H4
MDSDSNEDLYSVIFAKLKELRVAERITKQSAAFMTGVVEYVISELLEVAASTASDEGKNVIKAKILRKAIDDDQDFWLLFRDSTLCCARLKTSRLSIEEDPISHTQNTVVEDSVFLPCDH